MSTHEAPTTVIDDHEGRTEVGPDEQTSHDREFEGLVQHNQGLDNQRLTEPETAQQPEKRPTAVLSETTRPKPELSPDLKGRLGRIAITDEDGYVPYGENKTEARWRRKNPYVGWAFFKALSPGEHKHQHMVNAVDPKVGGALDGRKQGFLYGDHHVAVDNTVAVIRSLAVRLHANQYRVDSLTTYHSMVDHTGQRRSGYGTNQYRRGVARINQALGRMRSPEQQISDETKIALREIGKLQNLDLHMADADASDGSGRLGDALRSGRPAAIRHELKVLSDEGVISEHNPLHARWSEAMDPKNVKAFRQYLVKSTNEKVHGMTPASANLGIAASGIMGDLRPRAVADYLGVSYEEWHEQRTGFLVENNDPIASNQHHKVPKEVVDQICFLMKLDGRVVEYVKVGEEKIPITALDVLIEEGAARPMTDSSRSSDPKSPLSKGPMERVEDKDTEQARLALEEQDHNEEQIRLLSMQYGANLDELNRRLAGLDPENEEEADEYKMLLKQKAKLIARLKSHDIPIPEEQDAGSSKD